MTDSTIGNLLQNRCRSVVERGRVKRYWADSFGEELVRGRRGFATLSSAVFWCDWRRVLSYLGRLGWFRFSVSAGSFNPLHGAPCHFFLLLGWARIDASIAVVKNRETALV